MRIEVIVGGIILIVLAIFFSLAALEAIEEASLPAVKLESYSLEWLPPETPIDIDRFQIDTNEGVIKYLYSSSEQTDKPVYISHPLGFDNASSYNVNRLSINKADYLLVSFSLSRWTTFTVTVLSVFAVIFGIAGTITLIKGIRVKV